MHPARPPRHSNTTPSPSLQSLQCACKVSRSSETHSQSDVQHPDLRPNLGQIQLTSSRFPTQTSVLPNPFQKEFHISPKPPPTRACNANPLRYPIVRPPLFSSARVQTRSRARSGARPVNTSFDTITPACTPHVPRDTPTPPRPLLYRACSVPAKFHAHRKPIAKVMSNTPSSRPVLPNPFQNEFHISPKPPPALACNANPPHCPIVRPPLFSSARVQTRSRARSDATPVNTSFDTITPACTPHVPQDTPTPPGPLLYRACSVPAKFRAHRKPTARVMSNTPISVPTLAKSN